MKRFRIGAVGVCIFFLAATIASAEVKVAVDHNDNDHATAEFKFKNVPSPSKTDAATGAKFKIVDGERDETGADLDVLHDGKLPIESDQPAANFFFNVNTEGGRLTVDLGDVISIKQVNTYSWHPDTRGPQVYNLYASDGKGAKFKADPAKEIAPDTCGWKLIAKVDTRAKDGTSGGQYGVSISDATGPIGKYRYLLFEISRTEGDDQFGNTFYSEIDVIDANELLKQPGAPAAGPGIKTVSIEGGKYTATIDTTETPDLSEWAANELAPVVADWYPKIVKALPSEGFEAPKQFSITFHKDKNGVADTSGTRINCAASWFRKSLKGEAKGAIVHEMVHVVQQYGAARRQNPNAQRNPGWLVEGIPDYIRWYHFEATSKGASISKQALPRVKYDDKYRISANFLHWAIETYDKNLIQKLNAAMREGKYSDDIFKELTGKTVQTLGDEWKANLAKSLGVAQ
jgi:hypothetical protein